MAQPRTLGQERSDDPANQCRRRPRRVAHIAGSCSVCLLLAAVGHGALGGDGVTCPHRAAPNGGWLISKGPRPAGARRGISFRRGAAQRGMPSLSAPRLGHPRRRWPGIGTVRDLRARATDSSRSPCEAASPETTFRTRVLHAVVVDWSPSLSGSQILTILRFRYRAVAQSIRSMWSLGNSRARSAVPPSQLRIGGQDHFSDRGAGQPALGGKGVRDSEHRCP